MGANIIVVTVFWIYSVVYIIYESILSSKILLRGGILLLVDDKFDNIPLSSLLVYTHVFPIFFSLSNCSPM